ncbi:MAG: helix-turn-helix transcriptional regulator [Nitrospiria bacterium]
MATKLRAAVPAKEFIERNFGPMTFGKFLVSVRLNMDMSQTELAKRLKVTRSRICDIEKGRILVSPGFAGKIAKLGGFPEKLAIKYCLQDQLRKANIKYDVNLDAA